MEREGRPFIDGSPARGDGLLELVNFGRGGELAEDDSEIEPRLGSDVVFKVGDGTIMAVGEVATGGWKLIAGGWTAPTVGSMIIIDPMLMGIDD